MRRLVLIVLAFTQVAWLDPNHTAREASRLFTAGKYADAATRYKEALVDHPDSALLHFNLGDASYKNGKFNEALNAFGQVPATDDDRAGAARVAYNVGNTKYRLGEAAAAAEPQKALGLWAEALAAYRRAMGAAPDDVDAKVNHEFVEQKIAELKKKLEEQKKEQEQKQQQKDQQKKEDQDEKQADQQQDQKQQDQQQDRKDQQADQQQKQDEKQQDAEQKPEPAQQDDKEQQKAAGGAGDAAEGEKKDGEMSKQEAAALLDSERDLEVRPEEITKRLQGAAVAEPAQDW